jgi:hypothetical protein
MAFEKVTEALSNARLLAVDGKLLHFDFPFNPTSFKLTRSVNWAEQTPAFQPYTTLSYGNGASDKLGFELLLDTTETSKSVMRDIKKLYKFTLPGKLSEVIRPPLTLFIWEAFLFQGVVTSLEFDVKLFDETGTPKRANVTVAMTGKAFMDAKTALSFFGQTFSFL